MRPCRTVTLDRRRRAAERAYSSKRFSRHCALRTLIRSRRYWQEPIVIRYGGRRALDLRSSYGDAKPQRAKSGCRPHIFNRWLALSLQFEFIMGDK